ncbi:hypothetical protein AYX13_07041 [Cryptococcus neoformans]|nr:hypothetical protein AYX13_07041 [Cryptococcus neoformans var. grubii]
MIEKVRKEAVQGVADNGGNLEQIGISVDRSSISITEVSLFDSFSLPCRLHALSNVM